MDFQSNSDYALKEFYLGSRKFQFVADAVGLPIDQVNFIFAQVLALVVAYLFRVFLHPKNVSTASRHWMALSAGLCISYFCFGKQILLAVLLVIICYCFLNLLPSSIFHHATLFASITFLSVVHIQRQFYEDGLFVVDITGPLMIIVQKATCLAYSLHDGLFKETSKLTPLQKQYVIKSKPTALQYFSYLLCFHSILAGPFFMFTDYEDYIQGTHYLRFEALRKKENQKMNVEQENLNNNKTKDYNTESIPNNHYPNEEMCSERQCSSLQYTEPDPTESAWNKVFYAFICAMTVIFVLPNFPIKHVTENSFLSASMLYKVTYVIMTTSLARHLYYTGWFLADAVCTMSGLGFSGFDERGKSKWDLVSNVNIIGVEFGTSLKVTLESWNTGTMKWLRFLVYERAPAQKTILTYFLSSVWHGFYPGYYLTFLGGAFFTIISRRIRRSLRPRVLMMGSGAKQLYDFVTFLFTRLALSYVVLPFVLLRFWTSIYAYNSMKYYLHIGGILAACILPSIAPPIKESMYSNGCGNRELDRGVGSKIALTLGENGNCGSINKKYF